MREITKREKYRRILSGSFLFRGTDAAAAVSAFRDDGCSCMEFEAGEAVYTRTRFRRNVGIVLSGFLRACKPSDGGAPLVLNTFSVGGVFGAAAVFHRAERYVSEITAVKRSRVLFLSEPLLRRLFRQDARIAENYIVFLSGRICFLNGRIDCFAGGSAENRLAAFLLSLPRREEDGRGVLLPCSMTQLSGELNVSRASLYRAMDALCGHGLIRRSGRAVLLLEPDRLRTGGSLSLAEAD